MKKILAVIDHAIFYDDHTYRCTGWEEDEISQWKVENDIFFYKHDGMNYFERGDPRRRDASVVDHWALRITSALIEREIFGETTGD